MVEKDYRVTIPNSLRSLLHVGDELLITVNKAGQILLIPASRVDEILEQTAGMWQGRTDVPSDGVEYVNQLRQGHRLEELGIVKP
jgi:bifunctional DNA-binding transcriptional regulator/antitoxin component of YhaV-PrlF toxin-antitoxin module